MPKNKSIYLAQFHKNQAIKDIYEKLGTWRKKTKACASVSGRPRSWDNGGIGKSPQKQVVFRFRYFFVVLGYKNDVRSGILDVSIECLYNRDKRPRKAYKTPKRIVR